MKRLFSVSILAAGLAFLGAVPSQAATIGFSAVDANTVDVVISDLGGQIVAAYDFDIALGGGLVTDVTFGGLLGDASFFETIQAWSQAGDVLDVAEVSLLSDAELAALQDGSSVTVATIAFEGAIDPASLAFVWGPGQDVKGYRNQVIIPNPIPEPGTMILLGSGLVGLAGFARRRTKKSS